MLWPLIFAAGFAIGIIYHRFGPPKIKPTRALEWGHGHWLRVRRTSLRRNLIISTLPVALLILIVSLIAAISSVLITFNSAQFPYVGDGIRSMSGFWSFILGALLGGLLIITLLYLRLLSNDMFEALSEPWGAVSRRKATLSLVLLIVVIVGIPFVLFLISANASNESSKFVMFVTAGVSYLNRYAGGPVGFVGAILALLAFYLTIQQLRDFQSRITNFAQLLERIVELGKMAKVDDRMHIIAYTPAIGYLAENHVGWRKVVQAIIGIEKDPSGPQACKTKIITQPISSLAKWHRQFAGRKTKRRGRVEASWTDEATEEAKRIKEAIQDCDSSCYIEVPFALLPGYYCFFTTRRALIVAPLFLPLSAQAGVVTEATLTALPSPHMIGFETTDRGIIDQLLEQFDYIEAHAKSAPPAPPAQAVA